MSTDRCYFFHMKLITFLRHLRKLFSSKESKETVVIYFVLKYTKFLLYRLSLNIFSRKSFWKIIISCSTSTVICCRNKNSGISFCCQRITACLPWIAHLSFMLFLRAFTKLQKASIISSRLFVRPSVRPSLHMEQLGSNWTDFHDIWYLRIFWEINWEIHISLKSDKNNGCFTWKRINIFDHIPHNSS